jgi:hypothetical protein
MTSPIEVDERLICYQKLASDTLEAGGETANASEPLNDHSQMCGSSYGFWLRNSARSIALIIDFEDLLT